MAPHLSKEQYQLLKNIYEKKKIKSREPIRTELKNNHPDSNITQRQIGTFLKEQNQFIKIIKIIKPTVINNTPSYIVKWSHSKNQTTETVKTLLNTVPKLLMQYNIKHKIYWYKTNGINKFGKQ